MHKSAPINAKDATGKRSWRRMDEGGDREPGKKGRIIQLAATPLENDDGKRDGQKSRNDRQGKEGIRKSGDLVQKNGFGEQGRSPCHGRDRIVEENPPENGFRGNMNGLDPAQVQPTPE